MKTRPQYLNTRGLVFVYILLCVLTVLFTRSFFWETLYEGRVPDTLTLVVFFTIPVVLMVFLGIAVANFVGDIIARRPGVKFSSRLLGYFVVTVFFATVPMTIVTGISISEIVRFWHSFDADAATEASGSFAVDSFELHSNRFETILRGTDWNTVMSPARPAAVLPTNIAAVQDFRFAGGGWQDYAFLGHESGRLAMPPSQMEGFTLRELPRDIGFIRYVMRPEHNVIRLVSYDLGEGFDFGLSAIETQTDRFEVIGVLRDNLRILEVFYYGVFFFPPLLMTMIIAISFTRRITNPIAELTDGTRRVAEGDFSVQILARQGDELGLLVRSFNAMVQDLEKSRAALVKAEKISIWQNMAQQLAHEIKNPLTPIKLSAERVLRRWRNEPQEVGGIIEGSMLAIIQETEGLSILLDEFRTLSRPMEPSKSWIKFGEVVPEVTIPYQSSHPRVAFDMEHVDENLVMKIDKSQFSRVLTNLIINAIDAMDGSGSIEIRTELVKKRGMQFCRITVKDSGKGISQEESAHVFTPYFTTKESGTGLGLPIIERIVSDHGGSIWFNSDEGMGTVFFIDLPSGEGEGEGG